MSKTETAGARLRGWRRELRVTLDDVSRERGLAVSYLSRLENGQRPLRAELEMELRTAITRIAQRRQAEIATRLVS